jgi:hypothetical protein
LYLALPALEGLHAAWSKRLTPNIGYDAFQGPLAAGIAKIAEYYNQTEDSDAYIMSMGAFLLLLNGLTPQILIYMAVIHPEYKLAYFEKNWGKDMAAQVSQTAQGLVSLCTGIYYYSNIL